MPPCARCSRDRRVEQLDRGGIERDLRLVEQPDRARGGEQAGERELPLLPCREQPGGKIGERAETEGQQARRPRLAPLAAEEVGPEGEVLGDATARLDARSDGRHSG